MSDLVERLHNLSRWDDYGTMATAVDEAADELTRLREIAREAAEAATRLQSEVLRLRAELESVRADALRMASWIDGDCTCPCCGQIKECNPECTFATDCPQDAKRMTAARAVLSRCRHSSHGVEVLREICGRCGANSWRWLRCSFRGSTPQGDVDVDEYECTVCENRQDHA